MSGFLTSSLEIYARLFAASAPIAVMAIFIGMTPGYSPKERWQLAFRATSIALVLLLLSAFFGIQLLNFLGVDMNAFRVAGGLVLALIGLDMVRSEISIEEGKVENVQRPDITVTPLAFPIISGPGAISTLMIAKSEATTSSEHLCSYVAAFAIALTFYILFYITSFFSKLLKPAFIKISTKLFGLIVLAIGAQFLISGCLGFWK